MGLRLLAAIVVFAFGAGSCLWSAPKKKKKNEEEITQTLEEPKDPPSAVVVDASRLTYFVSPLSAKGLLSQQVRDALKNLLGQVHGAQIMKIRAFVAGSGDLRRVPALTSEIFTDKKLPLPAVTVVQVGALPLTGAQVVLEVAAVEKKVVNPAGIAILNESGGNAEATASRMTKQLASAGLEPDSVRDLTCFLDSLESEAVVRQQMAAAFPRAPAVLVQLRRDSAGDFTRCQAVAALPVRSNLNPQLSDSLALVGPVRVAMTGTQMGFGREDKDIRLALDRLGKALEGAGASWKSVVATDTYPLSKSVGMQVAAARRQLESQQHSPLDMTLVFEGLPSVDASFAIEATAIVER